METRGPPQIRLSWAWSRLIEFLGTALVVVWVGDLPAATSRVFE